ncbi:TPR end-of-group domain-containing protein [Hymenobacter persicinus]|uniref:Alpha/beta hydrolase n=1 Tax=Hymenobacter persicinus TaxID=2025506 RepID=A0A4Q5LHN5_9BACT|nr:hypothetical protein [Hymenobacter persicinus]RYU84356.1 hypothetical protein EWM57_01300 [Hymenobacter persicinus]
MAYPVSGQVPTGGSVTDSVRCRTHPELTYALYLPKGYASGRAWPVLYLFDPAGHGAEPVRLYQAAAEALGFILAGSNDSRNGSLQNSLEVAEIMQQDVQACFAVDGRRIYTGGFSGGSRVAATVALLSDNVVGVLGCGAGLPTLPNVPTKPPTWVYAGFAGLEDFNYAEMQELQGRWNQQQVVNTFFAFDGSHAWPPAPTMLEGLTWLELQALQAGTSTRPSTWLDSVYQRSIAAAAEQEAAGLLVAAANAYQRTSASFSGLHNVAAAQQGTARLVNSPLLAQQQAQQRTLHQLELTLQREAVRAYQQALSTRNDAAALDAAWWQQYAAQLGQLQHSAIPAEQHLGARALSSLRVQIFSRGYAALTAADYWAATTTFRLWTFVEPTAAEPYLQLATAYALSGQTSAALKTLEAAVAKGLTDRQQLEGPAAFTKLKQEKRYQKLLLHLPPAQ